MCFCYLHFFSKRESSDSFFLKDFIYLFLDRREGGQKQRERNMDVREKHQSVASCTCPDLGLGWQPWQEPCLGATWVTLCGMMPNLLSHTGQGERWNS